MESYRQPTVDLEGGGQPEAVDAAAGRPVHMDTTAVQLQVLPARQSDLRRWQSEEFERLDLGRCEQISGGGRLFVMICSLKRSAQLRGSGVTPVTLSVTLLQRFSHDGGRHDGR